MKQIEINRWARARARGMLMYVLVSGIVSFGIPMFVVMTFVFHHSRLPVAESAALWLAAGACYGFATWFVQEFRYRKAVGRPEG